MSAEDATINPDGSTTFDETPPTGDAGADAGGDGESFFQEKAQEGLSADAEGIDPAFYLLGAAFIVVVIYFLFFRTKSEESEDDFFTELDGDKVSVFALRDQGIPTRYSSVVFIALRVPVLTQTFHQIAVQFEIAIRS